MLGLHVLFVYGFKRLADVLESEDIVFQEIQLRASRVAPAQRERALAILVRNRGAILKELRARQNAPRAKPD